MKQTSFSNNSQDKRSEKGKATVIEISHLEKSFGALKAVDDVSFRIKEGKIFGLLGPNGAGKTTIVKMITGILRADSGSIRVNGYDVLTDSLKVKAALGYVPESSELYANLTGREHLEMVCNLHHLAYEKIDSRIERLLAAMDLTDSADQRICGYSKGMKQRLLLAGAIIHNPRVLILDEPFSGLDANVQSVILRLIKKFAADKRMVIFCSHILQVVESLCDRLMIIHHGRKQIEGSPGDITSQMNCDSLSAAFNRLTGATHIDMQAKGILNAIGDRQ
jgi:ABC-2 type transport system ATP-binding protein